MNVLQKQIQTTKATIFVIGGLPEDAEVLRMNNGVITIERKNENLDTSDYTIPTGD